MGSRRWEIKRTVGTGRCIKLGVGLGVRVEGGEIPRWDGEEGGGVPAVFWDHIHSATAAS